MLLRIHNMHRPTLEQLLIALATAGEASYLALAQSEISSPGPQRGGNESPHSRNAGEIMYAKYQEFWVTIGSEVSAEWVRRQDSIPATGSDDTHIA